MKLWIRSQNKKQLVEVSSVQIIKLNDSEEYGFVSYNDVIGDFELGTYKNEERALEVLDEINRHIEELYNCRYGLEYDLTQFTYEMPKE